MKLWDDQDNDAWIFLAAWLLPGPVAVFLALALGLAWLAVRLGTGP